MISAKLEVIKHLLPYCAEKRLSEFDVELEKGFRRWAAQNRRDLVAIGARRGGRPTREFYGELNERERELIDRYKWNSRGITNRTINK